MSLRLVSLSALVALARAQGVIISAVGDAGTSLPLQVDTARSDANVINAAEIERNLVNECGRTLLAGNIDIGANTENQLVAGTVTSVSKGSTVAVTISQGNEDGAGPYFCDMDLSSNADGTSGQTVLSVAETDNGDGTIALSVEMPADLACFGASTGNVCTVRCRNNATAGPFGGCFAVQQTDIAATENEADTIATEQSLAGINAQIAENIADLPEALTAIAEAGGTEAEQGVALVKEIAGIDSPAQATVAVLDVNATAVDGVAAPTEDATTTRKGRKFRTKTPTVATDAADASDDRRGRKNRIQAADPVETAAVSINDDDDDNRNRNNRRSMRWGQRV